MIEKNAFRFCGAHSFHRPLVGRPNCFDDKAWDACSLNLKIVVFTGLVKRGTMATSVFEPELTDSNTKCVWLWQTSSVDGSGNRSPHYQLISEAACPILFGQTYDFKMQICSKKKCFGWNCVTCSIHPFEKGSEITLLRDSNGPEYGWQVPC